MSIDYNVPKAFAFVDFQSEKDANIACVFVLDLSFLIADFATEFDSMTFGCATKISASVVPKIMFLLSSVRFLFPFRISSLRPIDS